ncbi:T-cell differentiation antigen CD6 [Danio aesculapii]|uniref:T-cell differentiation antigen CD6 n=1 Tax=Danio aesculapii TaxID=1142201 RepID=UPI0024BF7B74|nr:T-cell differentiation antigen CD6 [Danio aesculapii]
MPLLLLCVLFQALPLSQGLSARDDHPSTNVSQQADDTDNQIDLSTLSLSDGCSGTIRAFHQNTTIGVTLNLLDAQEKSKLALQICESLGCGRVFEHNATAAVHNGTCVANCILRDSKLHKCTTAAEGDCMNATEVTCEHHLVKLVEGRDRCAGRVELLDSGNWGTVCNDDFNETAGNIVCAQLKCGSAVRLGYFEAGRGAIHISKMKCNGSESSLWECSFNNNTDSYCGHKNDAGVVCSGSIKNNFTNSTTVPELTTLAASTVAMGGSTGVSGAVIGCIILSIALLIFIILNVAVCLRFRKSKKCVIHQRHSNSHTSLQNRSSGEIYHTHNAGIYNTQITPAARSQQYESLGPRMSSNYGSKFSRRTNEPPHNLDRLSDSDYEPHNTDELQTLHLNSQRDMNDEGSTCSGDRHLHNVEINISTFMSGDKPPLTSEAPYTHNQAVDVNDSSSTSSGEFYENTKTDTDNMPCACRKHHQPLLSYDDCHLRQLENKVDVNDSSSTSSGEFYQNTETDIEDSAKPPERTPKLLEKTPYASLAYGDHQLPGTHSNGDVNDSDSTSSGECYQNVDINTDNPQSEDEESPSFPELSVEIPLTGNTAGYSGCHVPAAHTQDGNDSDSTSSEECYQNIEIDENAFLHYGEESPSLPETSFQNPHFAQMTESTHGYKDPDLPRSLSQETENSSTASEASYVNVPPKTQREDNSADSSDHDYDEVEDW